MPWRSRGQPPNVVPCERNLPVADIWEPRAPGDSGVEIDRIAELYDA